MIRPPTVVTVLLLTSITGTANETVTGLDDAIGARDFRTALALVDAAREDEPGNPALQFRRAQILRFSGEAARALDELDDLRDRYPENVDYAFERALALAALERNEEALDDVNAAIRLAPDYEDLWVFRFRLLRRDRGLASQARLEHWQEEADRRFPGRAWSSLPEPSPNLDWTVTTGASYDRLDNGFGDWNRQFVGLRRETAAGQSHSIELSRNARGSTTDTGLAITAEYALAGDWLTGVYAGTAANPVFLPRVDLGGHVGRVLPGDWIVDVALRHRDFAATTASTASTSIEKYVAEFRLAYRFSISRVTGSPSFTSQGLSANWYYTDTASIGLQYGTGREIESLGGGRLLETDVDSVAVTGRHRVSPRVTLDWFVGIHDQGTLYRRQFVGLAVALRL